LGLPNAGNAYRMALVCELRGPFEAELPKTVETEDAAWRRIRGGHELSSSWSLRGIAARAFPGAETTNL
jgi:hypothetical protein